MLNAKHYSQYFICINSFTFHTISINIIVLAVQYEGFPGSTSGKEPTYQCGRLSSIIGLGISLGGEHSNPLQYSSLENPMDRQAWWTMVHKVAKRWT